MASLLSMGAGASEGLDKYLQRLMLEEQMAAAQQKTAADNDYRNRALEQSGEANRLTRESLNQNRQATQANMVSDNERANIARMPGGTIFTPERRDSVIKMRAAAPEQFDEQANPDPAATAGGVPTALAQNDPNNASTIRLRKTPTEMSTDTRLENANRRADLAERALQLRDELGHGNLDARQTTERRLTDWGPPVVTIGDVNNPGASRVVPRTAVPDTGAPAPVPGGVQTQAIGNETAAAQLGRLEELFKTAGNMVGPAEGRARSFGHNVPLVPVNQDWADFEAASSSFQNAVIKAITGAQMSEPEAKRIKSQIPLISDKPEVWQAKARQTKLNLADLERIIAQRQGGGGTGGTGKKVIRYDINGEVIP